MTDTPAAPTTPRTEAGQRLLAIHMNGESISEHDPDEDVPCWLGGRICAIEAEAALPSPPDVQTLRIAFEAGRNAAAFDDALAQVAATMDADMTGMADELRRLTTTDEGAPSDE